MHPVEIADRNYRAMKRPNIDAICAVARDMEAIRHNAGLAHRKAGVWREIGVTNCSYWSHAHSLGADTVSAPLINFQINGLFKRRR